MNGASLNASELDDGGFDRGSTSEPAGVLVKMVAAARRAWGAAKVGGAISGEQELESESESGVRLESVQFKTVLSLVYGAFGGGCSFLLYDSLSRRKSRTIARNPCKQRCPPSSNPTPAFATIMTCVAIPMTPSHPSQTPVV